MSEATKQAEADNLEETLGKFARRVIAGDPVADLFGVDDRVIDGVLHRAHQLYSSKSYDRAEVLLRGATALDDTRAYAHLLLGDILLKRRAFDEAVVELERAYELDSSNPFTLAQLGEAYVRTGKHSAAEQRLEAALESLDESSLHYKRAIALLRVAQGACSGEPSEATA